nr:hypothetical protein [Tanacetum cinerariifolium]
AAEAVSNLHTTTAFSAQTRILKILRLLEITNAGKHPASLVCWARARIFSKHYGMHLGFRLLGLSQKLER